MPTTEAVVEQESTTIERTLTPSVEAPRVAVKLAGVGVVKTQDVELSNGFAGVIVAGNSATLQRAGARTIITTGPLELRQGGAGAIMSVGDVRIERAGAGMLAAKSASVHEGGFIGLAITPRLVVEPGGRVLAGPRHVAVLAIVAAAAASLAVLLSRLVIARRPVREGGAQ